TQLLAEQVDLVCIRGLTGRNPKYDAAAIFDLAQFLENSVPLLEDERSILDTDNLHLSTGFGAIHQFALIACEAPVFFDLGIPRIFQEFLVKSQTADYESQSVFQATFCRLFFLWRAVGNEEDRPNVLRLDRRIIILSIESPISDGYFLPVVSFLP